jgi:hypothetical protein
MWEPADQNGIPNEEDQAQARRAIAQLQMELSTAMDLLPTAEAYVRAILTAIEARWAWLALVRRVPFEIFSVIFIMAAEKDWRSPASIVGVCRFWRDVVLATPQAWTFLDLRTNPAPRIASMFLQQSARCLLHFNVPWAPVHWVEYTTLASAIAHRTTCLVLAVQGTDLLLEDYQRLTRLTITGHQTRIPLDYLDITRFPNLRYFDGGFSRPLGTYPGSRFPRIESLIIHTDGQIVWLDAIRACSKTLTSLHITVASKGPSEPNPFLDLARLKHLAIITTTQEWVRQRHWAFRARTPLLETYNTNFGASVLTVEVDFETVAQLQCPSVDAVDLYSYSNLLQLRAIGSKLEVLRFIDQFRRHHGVCPALEVMVVDICCEDTLRQISRNLRKRNRATGVELKVIPNSEYNWNWPGDIRTSVRLHYDNREAISPSPVVRSSYALLCGCSNVATTATPKPPK